MDTEAHKRPGPPRPHAPHGPLHYHAENAIALPAPTHWPLILALGLTLTLAGLVTNFVISALGGVLALCGIVGWFRQVLPHEAHELVPVADEEIEFEREGRHVQRYERPSTGHATTPIVTFPISSGIKGGFVGGTVMILLAEIYGVLRFHSIWYVVNLLGGVGVTGWSTPSDHELASFHLAAFVIAVVIHTSASFLVGLLYGALLPILPRHPVVLGGVIAPALWTGLLHSTLGLLNPFFDAKINWYWFALSQVGYGITAGWVVARSGRLAALEGAPLAVRLGIEQQEPHPQRKDDE